MKMLRWHCVAAGTYWSTNQRYRISHYGTRWWVFEHRSDTDNQLLTKIPRTLDEAMSWASTHHNYQEKT